MIERERDAYRSALAAFIGVQPDQVTLFAKGRVALYAILRTLGIGPGDEVILPAFTCVAVPNAILYVGARPVYVDIDPASYLIDPAAVGAAITPRSRVVLAQNTFGLSADLDALSSIAADHGLTVVDDSTHGLGGRFRGRPNGTSATFSFFSTQWSKPISTGLGGFAVASTMEGAARLRELERSAAEPRRFRTAALRTLLWARERAGHGRVLMAGRGAYRWLGGRGLVPASSGSDELDATTMPRGFYTRLSEAQARLGTERLRTLPADLSRRRAIAARYSAILDAHGCPTAAEPSIGDHAYLRYPLRVRDRGRFVAAARRDGIDVGDWFVSPVHPVLDRLDRWGYVTGSAPHAERVCRQIINLPTDPAASDGMVGRVESLILRELDLIVRGA